ncbi:MAG TPA: methyltransferase domain-containing protein [Burkholderiaceae bacterium]|nr:methyltransferase domain-containing protein [Burkholderiaceae bacterium]
MKRQDSESEQEELDVPDAVSAWGAGLAASAELARFLDSPPGRYVLAWEQAQFDDRVANIFGFTAVQLGLPQLDALRANRMPQILRAGESIAELESHASCTTALLTQFEELPFATQSIDLLVLPHALELSPAPHRLLREAERVLVPEGKLIVTCFNPYSLWGARQLISRIAGQPFLPRAGKFISVPHLKDWLTLLSFEVEGGRFGCYRPAVHSERWLKQTAFLEDTGDRWWPVLGAVYMLAAVKRVRGMRLIGPTWKARPQRAAVIAPAAQRPITDRANAQTSSSLQQPSNRTTCEA